MRLQQMKWSRINVANVLMFYFSHSLNRSSYFYVVILPTSSVRFANAMPMLVTTSGIVRQITVVWNSLGSKLCDQRWSYYIEHALFCTLMRLSPDIYSNSSPALARGALYRAPSCVQYPSHLGSWFVCRVSPVVSFDWDNVLLWSYQCRRWWTLFSYCE